METFDLWKARENGETESAMLVSIVSQHGHHILTGKVVEVHLGSRTIRNYDSDREPGLADLTIYEYLRDDGLSDYCSATICYKDAFVIDEARAAGMVKTLAKVNKLFRRAYEKLGNCGTLGEYFRRYADAIGCAYILILKENGELRSSSYDDNRDAYLWKTLGNGKNQIDYLINDHYAQRGLKTNGERLETAT